MMIGSICTMSVCGGSISRLQSEELELAQWQGALWCNRSPSPLLLLPLLSAPASSLPVMMSHLERRMMTGAGRERGWGGSHWPGVYRLAPACPGRCGSHRMADGMSTESLGLGWSRSTCSHKMGLGAFGSPLLYLWRGRHTISVLYFKIVSLTYPREYIRWIILIVSEGLIESKMLMPLTITSEWSEPIPCLCTSYYTSVNLSLCFP